jgi:glycosyltransferase involved in cell wall biosynthesis
MSTESRIITQPGRAIGSLVVFSDDWGRHPSSSQHLIGQLLDRYPVLWVNTIGTRTPRFDLQTFRRVSQKLRDWTSRPVRRTPTSHAQPPRPENLQVVSPKMWPWFGSPRNRRLNAYLLSRQLSPLIETLPKPVVAVTTLPITADLPEVLPAFRWVYYCVDDFSQWPGLDGKTLKRMDHEMIHRADTLIAVSEHLQGMIASEGRTSLLLTHGVDLEFWNAGNPSSSQIAESPRPLTNGVARSSAAATPRIVFWGVIDRRIDSPTLIQLSRELPHGTIELIGPQQDPDSSVLSLPNVITRPALALAELPRIASEADVLIMPYANLPVTRAMQPLKLKEYLATGKPVVVNRLPSTDEWGDCMDVARTPDEFCGRLVERLQTGLPDHQKLGRQRLKQESWHAKAQQFEAALGQCSGQENRCADKNVPRDQAPVLEF